LHIAEALIALGGAFLVCGLIARAGVRVGLPTIPLFMIAGILFGPNTPGIALVGDPAELELVARLGLIGPPRRPSGCARSPARCATRSPRSSSSTSG
jgi:hypothetical protein